MVLITNMHFNDMNLLGWKSQSPRFSYEISSTSEWSGYTIRTPFSLRFSASEPNPGPSSADKGIENSRKGSLQVLGSD